ncbi:MAG TPA: HepT-like ribonuclease domain-containing protein [Candidatus Limnocylindria bacterium]
MKHTDRDRLSDIADAIAAIRAHSKRRSDERLRRDAVLYNLMILGEAVKGLSDETRARRPEIKWREIAGLRDLLAHEYFQIELSVIEDIVARDLGPLAVAVAALRRGGGGR